MPFRRKISLGMVVLVILVQGLITLTTYSGFGRFLFAQGSDSGYLVVRPALWVACLVWLVTSFALVAAWRATSTSGLVGIVAILCLVWLASGRAVGVGFGFGYRVVAGYFFIRTTSFEPSVDSDEPQFEIEEVRWPLETVGLVDLRSGDRRHRVFAGPLCAGSATSLLRSFDHQEDGFESRAGTRLCPLDQ